jgi:hypothetical protein
MTDRWWPYCAAHWQDSQREVHDALQELEESDQAGASVGAVVSHPKTAPFTTEDERFDRYRTAYLAMARKARYRPAAPSDGCGHILLDEDEIKDRSLLEAEARKYAVRFVGFDDEMEYHIGCPDFSGNRAFCYLIEAANALCSPKPKLVKALIELAMKELKSAYPDDFEDGQ